MKRDQIKLIVYDFDGVMTDNRVHVSQHGEESVTCNRADGLGVNTIKSMGISQVILSTETNDVVQQRASKLGLKAIHGSDDKSVSLFSYCNNLGIDMGSVLYVGNDMNDYEVMQRVGFAVCPSDAHPEVRKISDLCTKAMGGGGVIRELADWLSADSPVISSGSDAESSICDNVLTRVQEQLEQHADVIGRMLRNESMIAWIAKLAELISHTLRGGGKVLFAGNGGSFADAQHLAAEFVGRFFNEREPLAAVCLGTNCSSTTAISNDYSFSQVYSREIKALATDKDVLIVISTSGNSDNLLDAVQTAESLGVPAYGLLGKSGGRLATMISSLVVPSESTPRIQEAHITVGHVLCELVDYKLGMTNKTG